MRDNKLLDYISKDKNEEHACKFMVSQLHQENLRITAELVRNELASKGVELTELTDSQLLYKNCFGLNLLSQASDDRLSIDLTSNEVVVENDAHFDMKFHGGITKKLYMKKIYCKEVLIRVEYSFIILQKLKLIIKLLK